MVNAMLFRIHQSGHMGLLETDSRALVAEGIRCYKNMRGDIASALPFWPLGLAQSSSEWVSVGLKIPHKAYVAVWRINSTNDCCMMPISHLKGIAANVRCIYPSENENCDFRWDKDSGTLSVCLRQNKMARMFELDY